MATIQLVGSIQVTKFIIDEYDKYSPSDKAAARFIFRDRYNSQWAIKEYEYKDGQLARPLSVYENDNMNQHFMLFDSYDEAYEAVMTQRAHDHRRLV